MQKAINHAICNGNIKNGKKTNWKKR
jgi:hypothetical protein